MKVLVLDTETTGLPLWREPSDHPGQPHIVDLGCELYDGEDLIDSLDIIVNPGVPIPDEVAQIHGITTEIAQRDGVSKAEAIRRFFDLAAQADMLVGHNVSFDIRMIRIDTARVTGAKWENPLPTFCTMLKSVNHCRILSDRPKHQHDWKWPRLNEAYRHFFGEELVDAHRALPDCQASRRIYFHLRSIERAAMPRVAAA